MHFLILAGCFLTHCFSLVAETAARDIRLRESFLSLILPRPSIASRTSHAIPASLATMCPDLSTAFRDTFLFFVLRCVFVMVSDASPGTPESRGHDRGRPWISTEWWTRSRSSRGVDSRIISIVFSSFKYGTCSSYYFASNFSHVLGICFVYNLN